MKLRFLCGAAIAGLACLVPVTASAATPLPYTIVSTGDSITRGFDAGFDCILTDCVQYSWSTGASGLVNSHYTRLVTLNPGLSGRGFNLAKTGARVADLAGQLQIAGYFKADYVTVLMGANDVCTSSAATMTPTQTFFTQFYTALGQFFYLNPNGRLFVASIPDVRQLWTLLHNNANATGAWNTFHICQSMLSATNTDADRDAVAQQEAIDNWIMANVCAAFANCRFDGYATYAYRFTAGDVSPIDYFHPSVTGQMHLGGVTWPASFWGS